MRISSRVAPLVFQDPSGGPRGGGFQINHQIIRRQGDGIESFSLFTVWVGLPVTPPRPPFTPTPTPGPRADPRRHTRSRPPASRRDMKGGLGTLSSSLHSSHKPFVFPPGIFGGRDGQDLNDWEPCDKVSHFNHRRILFKK